MPPWSQARKAARQARWTQNTGAAPKPRSAKLEELLAADAERRARALIFVRFVDRDGTMREAHLAYLPMHWTRIDPAPDGKGFRMRTWAFEEPMGRGYVVYRETADSPTILRRGVSTRRS